MRISKNRLEIELARNKMTANQLANTIKASTATISRATNGKEVNTSTVGRIAEALGIPVEQIIEMEE